MWRLRHRGWRLGAHFGDEGAHDIRFRRLYLHAEPTEHRFGTTLLLLAQHAHNDTFGPGTSCPTGSMDVVLLVLRRIDVDDQFYPVDMHAARGYVGGDECLHAALRPTLQRSLPGTLRHATVHGDGSHAEIIECVRYTLGGKAVLHEHDRFAGRIDQVGKVLELRLVTRPHAQVTGTFEDGSVVFVAVGSGNRMEARVLHVVLDQVVDVAVERRREKQRLTLLGATVKQPRDLRRESHVGHAVGLVDHDKVDIVEDRFAAVDEVGEPTGRGDGDIDAALQIGDLAEHARATEERSHPAPLLAAVRHQNVGDLLGQLTGRYEHQRARGVRTGLFATLQECESIGQGLARSGGRFRADVVAAQRVGQGDLLDRKRGVDACVGKQGDQARRKAELVE